jgi:thioredoxin-related protein
LRGPASVLPDSNPPNEPSPAASATASEAPRDSASETATAASTKTGREPIYNEAADARADIKSALERAKYDHKRVLVKFGGNWCGWCFKLHDVLQKHPDVAPLLRSEYELVLVDAKTNEDLLNEYGAQHAFPYLTVLDASGQILVNQRTLALERGSEHDPERVKEFLIKWQAEPLDAAQVLASGIAEASNQDKLALIHIGAPSCGWCRVLDRFLFANRDLIRLDYVDVKIDMARMKNCTEVAEQLRKDHEAAGIPWMAILNADGETLATSDSPGGNIGYPFKPREIEFFVAMLNKTRRRITLEQVGDLESQLRDFAAKKQSAH